MQHFTDNHIRTNLFVHIAVGWLQWFFHVDSDGEHYRFNGAAELASPSRCLCFDIAIAWTRVGRRKTQPFDPQETVDLSIGGWHGSAGKLRWRKWIQRKWRWGKYGHTRRDIHHHNNGCRPRRIAARNASADCGHCTVAQASLSDGYACAAFNALSTPA